jgi:hypothetical protein
MTGTARASFTVTRTGRAACLLAAALALALSAACAVHPSDPDGRPGASQSPSVCAHPATVADLDPPTGAWFGVSLDGEHDSLDAYSKRLGAAPAVAVTFVRLPFSAADKTNLDAAVDQARARHSMLLLTLEPHEGLPAVTDDAVGELAVRLDRYNKAGVPVFVRFAHEMNGSWYAWGQDPIGYVAAFRRVADAVHAGAPGSAMMWAPNYGGGYPFAGGKYQAKAGTAAFRALDTHRDGRVDGADDSYAPYWPGRGYVDWVGMSLYHWGSTYPWGENEVPEAGKFTDMLRGTYDGAGGDQRAVPDFYGRYGRKLGLPVAVTETAAFYAPGGPGGPGTKPARAKQAAGASELAVKQAWWSQVFAPQHPEQLPMVKMVNWFEWDKLEAEVGAQVDWSATLDEGTRERFVAALPAWAQFATDVPDCD